MAGAAHRQDETAGRYGPAAGRPQSHAAGQEFAGSLDQFAKDLSLLAGRLEPAEPDPPSLEDAWDQQAADALVTLYESGGAGLAHRLSDDADLQARLARIGAGGNAPEFVAVTREDQPAGRDWIDARLAEVTRAVCQSHGQADATAALHTLGDRFERLERRFDSAIAKVAPRTDAEGLRQLESKVGELFARADDARGELGRLLTIEAKVGALSAGLSDERLASLVKAAAPTPDELSAFAQMAADRACERLVTRDRHEPAAGPGAAVDAMLPEISGVRHLLADFIDEHRHSEQQVAEALDTMQHAMQHVLDRIEAIEAGQAATGEAATGEAAAMPADETFDETPFDDPFYVQGEVRFGAAAETEPLAEFPDPTPFDTAPARADDAPQDPHASDALVSEPAELGSRPASPRSSEATDRAAFIAMARLAAERAANEARDGVPIERGAPVDPEWIPHRRGLLRPGVLLTVSLLAFLLAGCWLIYGSGVQQIDTVGPVSFQPAETKVDGSPEGAPLRSHLPDAGGGSSAPDAGGPAAAGGGAREGILEHAVPDEGPGQSTRIPQAQGNAAPSEPEQLGAPAGDNLVQGPVGVIIDQGYSTLSPQDLMRLRQKQRMARLSTRLGQDAAKSMAQSIALPGGDAAARPSAAVRHDVSALQDLPPITIGPNSLRHAAASGDAFAQLEVAARFAEGTGVKQDFTQAATWYQRAASQGQAVAQYRLATLYERGLGVPADEGRARVWYGRAAGQGNVKAMHNLAVLSAGGATPDYAAAAQWSTQAANYGLADSQYNLGVLYEAGHGVPVDAASAYKWYALAAARGDKEAVRRRDVTAGKLSHAVLKAAKADVAIWRARMPDKLANDARAAGQAWKAHAAGHAN